MMMSDAEIVNSYLHAADRKAQIQILADLNMVSKAEILIVLHKHDLYHGKIPEIKLPKHYIRKLGRRVSMISLIAQLGPKFAEYYRDGLNDREIGELCDVSSATVFNWRKKECLPAQPRHTPLRPEIRRLYDAGYTDRQIASKVNIYVQYVSSWRYKFKLPPNKRGCVMLNELPDCR